MTYGYPAATLSKRSHCTNEFVVKSDMETDSFLNTILQTYWMFPMTQVDLMAFSRLKNQVRESELTPLITSIQDFYRKVDEYQLKDEANDRKVYVFDSTRIRQELFKFHYLKGLYTLNQPTSISKALNDIHKHIHTWYEEAYKVKCNDSNGFPPCLVHGKFFINQERTEQCACGPKPLDKNSNLFAMPINA